MADPFPRKVLVVDDDPVCREVTIQILSFECRDLGIDYIEAENGQHAIETAREQDPALILMDIAMPVLSGSGAIPLLKADPDTRHIPVVAVTALALPGKDRELMDLGFDGFLAKPIDYDKLVNTVRSFLDPA